MSHPDYHYEFLKTICSYVTKQVVFYILWMHWKSYAFFENDLNRGCFCLYFSLFWIKTEIYLFCANVSISEATVCRFSKIDILENFAKFTRKKNLIESLNNAADLSACNFIKKRMRHRCFFVNFAKSLSATFMQNTNGYKILESSKIDGSPGTSFKKNTKQRNVALKSVLHVWGYLNFVLWQVSLCFVPQKYHKDLSQRKYTEKAMFCLQEVVCYI